MIGYATNKTNNKAPMAKTIGAFAMEKCFCVDFFFISMRFFRFLFAKRKKEILRQNIQAKRGSRRRGIKIAGTMLAVRTLVAPMTLRPTRTIISEPVIDI